MFAVEHADVTMSVNARICVKGTTLTTQCCLFVLFSFDGLITTSIFKIPASQIVISTYNYLIYYLLFLKKSHRQRIS